MLAALQRKNIGGQKNRREEGGDQWVDTGTWHPVLGNKHFLGGGRGGEGHM